MTPHIRPNLGVCAAAAVSLALALACGGTAPPPKPPPPSDPAAQVDADALVEQWNVKVEGRSIDAIAISPNGDVAVLIDESLTLLAGESGAVLDAFVLDGCSPSGNTAAFLDANTLAIACSSNGPRHLSLPGGALNPGDAPPGRHVPAQDAFENPPFYRSDAVTVGAHLTALAEPNGVVLYPTVGGKASRSLKIPYPELLAERDGRLCAGLKDNHVVCYGAKLPAASGYVAGRKVTGTLSATLSSKKGDTVTLTPTKGEPPIEGSVGQLYRFDEEDRGNSHTETSTLYADVEVVKVTEKAVTVKVTADRYTAFEDGKTAAPYDPRMPMSVSWRPR